MYTNLIGKNLIKFYNQVQVRISENKITLNLIQDFKLAQYYELGKYYENFIEIK